MCASITLGIWNANQLHRLKLENVDLDSKTECLKNQTIKQLEGQSAIELVYCGLIMEDENTLSSYGIKNGSTIHVLEKKPTTVPPEGKKLSAVEVQQLANSFKAFKMSRLSPVFRTALQRLSRPEVLETIIAATPGLADDPAAIAIIQDPELIVHLAQPETIVEVAEKHPTLIEAAQYIAAHIHDEQANINSTQAATSSGYSYSLEALSDDEDMDGIESSSTGHPLTRNASYNAITAAQLAAAIANATNTAFNTNSVGMPGLSPNPGMPTPTAASLITNEMFTHAMQQAFATASSPAAAPLFPPVTTTPNRTEQESVEVMTQRLAPQLEQMHEIGLTIDSVNLRALQATNGNVEAAIELILNGVIE